MTLRNLMIFVLCLASTALGADDTLTLTVTVMGVTPNQGQVVVTLFDNEKNYMKKALIVGREEALDNDAVNVVFPGLTIGTYAASVYYDLDSDGELDTGMFRIPSEPVGFSNNARGRFGPAKWKQTSFQLTEDKNITVQVVKAIK
jgi:uncharacterized protein (DUF2141 family)